MAVLVCFLVLKSQEELFWIEVKVLNCLDFFGVFTCGKTHYKDSDHWRYQMQEKYMVLVLIIIS